MASEDFVIIEHSDANSQNSQESVQKITEWLAPTEYSSEGSEFRKHVGAHSPGTGNWIFSTHQVEKWSRSEDVGTLWIKGIPGSGKSVVAANLIKTFLEKESHPVLYFFFRHTIDSNSRPIFLVRDFLAQLLPHSTQLASQLKRLMVNFPDIEVAPIKDLWDALLASLTTLVRVFVVVDALDEVQIGQEAFIADYLLKLNCIRSQTIKLVVTSRPLPSFEKPSETAHTAILRLSGKLVDVDILAYISHRLHTQQQRNLNQEEIASIKGSACGKKHGLFLQTRLMLDEVLRSNEPIQSLLERSMRSMSETYQSLLREHSIRAAVSEELQLHVLEWVIHASRPLRLLELATLLCSQGLFADIPSAKRALRVCCGPLLEVLENETIQVIHHSFTEFLLDGERVTEESHLAFPVLHSTMAHKRLASECLDYMFKALAAHEFDLNWVRDQEKTDFLLKFPFLQYCVQNWPSHVLRGSVDDNQVFEKLDSLLSSGSRDFHIWLHLSPESYKSLLLGSEAIHVGSFLGLKAYVEYLLQRGANPNSERPGGCTPIMLAAMRGYADVIDFLVEHGAESDAKDSLGLTAMHMAAAFNHGGAIHALARSGSDLLPCKTDTVGGIGTPEWRPYNPIPTPRQRKISSRWDSRKEVIEITPIRLACELGCSDAVAALIQCMVSLQLATVRLQWAAYIGHAEILSILLECPEVARNIDQADENGDTALTVASREKWPGAVRVLLDAGANISARSENVAKLEQAVGASDRKRRRIQNSCGKTALEAWTEPCNSDAQDSDALLENMEAVATRLIRAGCDVDARSPDGSTPLFRWSTQSQTQPGAIERFVSILLQHGADPRATAEGGNTPLHMMHGHEREHEAILKLINAGADINAVRLSDGKTPLLAMIATSQHTIDVLNLQRWIDYGADFNKCDNEGNTVLHYLMRHSWSNEKVSRWIDVCNPRAVNVLGETCLFSIPKQWPASSFLSRVMGKAVKAGLDLEARNNFGRTALLEACFRGGNGHVLPFIRNHANAAARDNNGKNCLHLLLESQSDNLAALSRDAKDLLQLAEDLIGAGANPTVPDFSGNQLIHSAVWQEKYFFSDISSALSSLEVAVQLGIDCKAKNNAGRTALHLATSKRLDPSIGKESFDTRRLDFLLQPTLRIPVSTQDNDGITALHLAAACSDAMFSQLFSAGADIRAKDFRNRTPLHFAAANLGNTTGMICDIYQQHGWSVDELDIKGRTPLFDACSAGNYEAVKLLLESGASTLITDKLQRTPLHAAATYRLDSFLVKIEEQFYAGMDNSSKFPQPFYLWRRGDGNKKVIRLLQTMLRDEESQNHIQDVIHTLLSSGADLTEVDSLDCTPYDLALLNSNNSVAHLLRLPPEIPKLDESENQSGDPDTIAPKWPLLGAGSMEEITKFLSVDEIIEHGYLEMAIYSGNEARLVAFLKSGVDLSNVRKTDNNLTIIHAVVGSGMISMMKIIAPYISDINEYYPPLLHHAVEREDSNLEMVKLLLELGADPKLKYPKDCDLERYQKRWTSGRFPSLRECHTVLHKLSHGWCWWHSKAIDLLATAGVDMEVKDSNGEAALHIAVSDKVGFWQDQCVEMLLSKGADVNAIHEKTGNTALSIALKSGCGMPIVRKLLTHGAKVDFGTSPPIISAIEGGDIESFKLLLDAGADPNGFYGPEKQSLLLTIADQWTFDGCSIDEEAFSKLITVLLEAGADPYGEISCWDMSSTKVFHAFCRRNALITPFFDFGIDLEVKDESGRTPLHAACSYEGHQPQGGINWVAFQLLERDVEIDAVDGKGDTPLLYRAQLDEDSTEIFSALLRNGASVNKENEEGRTALYYIFNRSGYDVEIEIEYPLKELMARGADPTKGTFEGEPTNLHMLAKSMAENFPAEDDEYTYSFDTHYQFYQEFIDLGCNSEAKDDEGNTPLFYFVKNLVRQRRYEDKIINPSIAHCRSFFEKCDLNAVNEDLDNILHAVARLPSSKGNDDAPLFRLLMEMGVDPKHENTLGVSPLDIAATCGKQSILDMFERETE
ncbi:hypothetical protein ACEPPN_015432 [Leptodophora sp. 'Broadleaf-Isolate-01']